LSRRAAASGKITNALAAARPNLFYLFSPEAFRLTLLVQDYNLHINEKCKAGKGPSARAAGSLACEVAAIGLT
jgi:hypothetical protein